jgi:hypothetical protein
MKNTLLKLASIKSSLTLVFVLVALLYGIGLYVTGDPVLLKQKLDGFALPLMIWRVCVYTAIAVFFFKARNKHRALGNTKEVQRLHKIGWIAVSLISFIEFNNLLRYSSGAAL